MVVDTILREPELRAVEPALAAIVRPGIAFTLDQREADELPIGASKVGGAPDLPPVQPWPVARLDVPPPSDALRRARPDGPFLPPDGRLALPFIAQIALAEVVSLDAAGILPATGLLSFFFNPVAFPSDARGGPIHDRLSGVRYDLYGHDDPANWRVVYHPAGVPLARATPPADLPAPPRYTPAALTFAAEPTLPAVETCFIGEIGAPGGRVALSEEEWEIYNELRYETRAVGRHHQLLGHPDTTQPFAMERSFAARRSQLFPEVPPQAEQPPASWQRELEGVRLLLQLDAPDGGPSFGRDGRVYFFIREADLVRGDFARSWALAI